MRASSSSESKRDCEMVRLLLLMRDRVGKAAAQSAMEERIIDLRIIVSILLAAKQVDS